MTLRDSDRSRDIRTRGTGLFAPLVDGALRVLAKRLPNSDKPAKLLGWRYLSRAERSAGDRQSALTQEARTWLLRALDIVERRSTQTSQHDQALRLALTLELLGRAAYLQRDFDLARQSAERLLTVGSTLTAHGFEQSDTSESAFTLLGRVALAEGDESLAEEYLHRSLVEPPSTSTSTMGPNLELALGLLNRGRSDALVAFLRRYQALVPKRAGRVQPLLDQILGHAS